MLPTPPPLADASDLYAPGTAWTHPMTPRQAKSAVMASRAAFIFEKYGEYADGLNDSDLATEQDRLQFILDCQKFHSELNEQVEELLIYANGDMDQELMTVMNKVRERCVRYAQLMD